jgi:hypothetical protein
MNSEPEIVVVDHRIARDVFERLVREGFGDMVKFVVDLDREQAAIGGQLHADAELLLLESGSQPGDLWGANYYPGRGREDCIEFTSLINIRPAQGNAGMEIVDPTLCERVRALTHRLIGEGEEL